MYCRFCGAENPDEAVFCKKCGKKLTAAELENAQSVSASSPTPQAVPPVQQNFAISCPYCHAGGESCHPIVKTDVQTSGGGYGFWNGCCGLILLGPVGLLCFCIVLMITCLYKMLRKLVRRIRLYHCRIFHLS